MPAHIPAGREDLWRHQAESDARIAQHEADLKFAEEARGALTYLLGEDAPHTQNADREVERLHDAYNREVAVNNRIYQERLAGLTSNLDHDPTAPVCPDCKGTGGPPGSDAHSACPTCRGWGRERREPIPVWSDADKQWINPATGHPVDLLADPAPADMPPAAQPYQPPEGEDHTNDAQPTEQGSTGMKSSTLWWLDGKDTSQMSFNEVSELAIRAGDLRDEMVRQGDPPERVAEVDREYQRLCDAQREAGERMNERRAERPAANYKPYQPAAKHGTTPNTTTTSGGTAMTSGVSYGGLKARIMGISDRTKETQGPLSQAIQDIETQIAEAMAANEESQALNETIQALQRAKELCEEALQMLGVAGDQAATAAAQLQ